LPGLSSYILDKIDRLRNSFEECGDKIVVLNDPAIIAWGIVKSITEVRIIMETGDLRLAAGTLANILGLKSYTSDIYKSLTTIGIATLNPPLTPMFIVEIPKTRIDHDLIESAVKYRFVRYTIPISGLEPLIAKLLHIGGYPYLVYAYTLLYTYKDKVKPNSLIEKYPEIKGKLDLRVIEKVEKLIEVFM
jgi:hypothetical protein